MAGMIRSSLMGCYSTWATRASPAPPTCPSGGWTASSSQPSRMPAPSSSFTTGFTALSTTTTSTLATTPTTTPPSSPSPSPHRFSREQEAINGFIEKAILDAEEKGVKVVNLGLLNQGEELNKNGELYIRKYPMLRTRIVDGSSLAVAVVLQSIPSDTNQVLLRGSPSKMAFALVLALCKRNVQVMVVDKIEYRALELRLPLSMHDCLVYSNSYTAKVWIVGDGLTNEEQRKAAKATHIIPFSQFPPRKLRKDCVYYSTPAMMVPKSLVNMHSCENWLQRRVISAWRIAGILHALEGWDQHECGDSVLDTEKVWSSALRHGFLPLASP